MKFSDKILAIRERLALTQQELADKLGVTKAAIGQIERGKTTSPSAELLTGLATKLSIRLDWLLLGEGEMLKPPAEESAPANKNVQDSGTTCQPERAPAAGEPGVSKDLVIHDPTEEPPTDSYGDINISLAPTKKARAASADPLQPLARYLKQVDFNTGRIDRILEILERAGLS